MVAQAARGSPTAGFTFSVDPVRFALARLAVATSESITADLLALFDGWTPDHWSRLLERARADSLLSLTIHQVCKYELECPAQLLERAAAASCLPDSARWAGYTAQFAAHLIQTLGDAGIEARVIKGQFLGQALYGDLRLRDSRDIDLVVRPDAVAAAVRVLVDMGYAPEIAIEWFSDQRFLRNNREATLRGMGGAFEIDLHWELGYAWTPRLLSAKELIERTPIPVLVVGNVSVPWFDGPTLFLLQASNIINTQAVELKAFVDLARISAALSPGEITVIREHFQRVDAAWILDVLCSTVCTVFGQDTAMPDALAQRRGQSSTRSLKTLVNVQRGLVAPQAGVGAQPSFLANARFTNSWEQAYALTMTTLRPSHVEYSTNRPDKSYVQLVIQGFLRRVKARLTSGSVPQA